MERVASAYLLIALLAAAVVGWAAFRWYHARDRRVRRDRARELSNHNKRMSDRVGADDPS
jgi:hypothetical protein